MTNYKSHLTPISIEDIHFNLLRTPFIPRIVPATTITARPHPAKNMLSQLLLCKDLNDEEDDIVDARPQHEEQPIPVDFAHRVPARHHDDLDEYEYEDLRQPRYEVAHARDHVLVHALPGHVAVARGEEGGGAAAEFGQLSDDDQQEQKLEQV